MFHLLINDFPKVASAFSGDPRATKISIDPLSSYCIVLPNASMPDWTALVTPFGESST